MLTESAHWHVRKQKKNQTDQCFEPTVPPQALCEKRVQNKQQTKDAASTFVEGVCAVLVEKKQMNQPQRINFSPQENKSSFRASLTASPVNNSNKQLKQTGNNYNRIILTETDKRHQQKPLCWTPSETRRNFVTEVFQQSKASCCSAAVLLRTASLSLNSTLCCTELPHF